MISGDIKGVNYGWLITISRKDTNEHLQKRYGEILETFLKNEPKDLVLGQRNLITSFLLNFWNDADGWLLWQVIFLRIQTTNNSI